MSSNVEFSIFFISNSAIQKKLKMLLKVKITTLEIFSSLYIQHIPFLTKRGRGREKEKHPDRENIV